MPDPLRVGVVGSGIGKSHIESYRELPAQFTVAALCDIDTARAQSVADEFQLGAVTADFDALCRRDDLDIIDICTPSYLHASMSLQALAAGKHVICEKPVAGSLREVDALRAAEAKAGKRLLPVYQYRFGNGAQKLKFLIEQGVAGTPYLTTVETAWRRRLPYYAVPWRGKWSTELGGALVTLAIHAHDLVYYMLGPARSVFARTATLVNPIETEDTVAASLAMADGSLCTLAVTTGSAFELSRHRFCFSNLVAESNTRPYHNTFEPWTFSGDSPAIDEQIRETLARFAPQPQRFTGLFHRFYLSLCAGQPMPVTLADARASLELITACYASARTGQPVALPIAPDDPYYNGWQPLSL